MKTVSLLSLTLDKHKPDVTFISEPGVGGVITDRMCDLGYNIIRVTLPAKSDEELKYKDKLAETYWAMRQWIMDGGSISDDPDIEQSLVSITHTHNKKDQLTIETPNPRVSALALTFAYQVPKRELPRGELDICVGSRYNLDRREHDPMDAMTIKD